MKYWVTFLGGIWHI